MTRMNNKRPFYNCRRLTMWQMTDEEAETYSETAISFEKRLTTYSDSVETNSTPLYGDGELIETAVSEGEGSLSLGIHHMTLDERIKVYNETDKNGTVISTGEEIPPYMCVALIAAKRGKIVELRKWLKVAFQKHEETVEQKESGGIKYSMPTLNGTYSENTTLGIKVARAEVDSTTAEGKAFIEEWFTKADFVAEDEDEDKDEDDGES